MATTSSSGTGGTGGATPPPTPPTTGTFISDRAIGFVRGPADYLRPTQARPAPSASFYRILMLLQALVPEESSGLIISHFGGVMTILERVERGVIQEFLSGRVG